MSDPRSLELFKRLFREGDDVHAGQALFKVDNAGYKATYDQAAASLYSAKAQVSTDCQKAQRYSDNKIEQRNVTTGSVINNNWLILDGF